MRMLCWLEHRVMQALVKHTVDEYICEAHCRRKLEDNRGLTIVVVTSGSGYGLLAGSCGGAPRMYVLTS
jgi:hypothetical protein